MLGEKQQLLQNGTSLTLKQHCSQLNLNDREKTDLSDFNMKDISDNRPQTFPVNNM
jgi:hypothetical protein